MPFQNPIVAGETLVRTGIKSEGFVTGLTGWRVDRTGTAEFYNLTARGSIAANSIQVPSNLAAVPGNRVFSVSSTLPAELVAAGYTSAIVWFSNDWNVAATTPKIKYLFLGTYPAAGGGLVLGSCVASNPSVSQTGIIYASQVIQNYQSSGLDLGVEWHDINDQAMAWMYDFSNGPNFQITSHDTGITRTPQFTASIIDPDTCQITLGSNFTVLGTNRAATYQNYDTRFYTFNSWIADFWQTAPMSANWLSDATRTFNYRKMPDGTVLFKGHAFKNVNAINGETIVPVGGLPAAYRPGHTHTFMASEPGRPYNGKQIVEVRSDGSVWLFDPTTTAVARVCMDQVRYVQTP
jgi:hypothetical protein